MEQFNSNTYKKQGVTQEFLHSCVGKLIILAIVSVILTVIAIMTVPTEDEMRFQMEDNIRQCIIDNDSILGDGLDESINNFGYIFTYADSTEVNQELLQTFNKYNKMQIFRHALYSTAYLFNNLHPEGVRIGLGIFNGVIPMLHWDDFVMSTGAVRGDYNKRLIRDTYLPDEFVGENPNLKPYHYQGNPDN